MKRSVLATPILLTLLKKLKDNKVVAIERYYSHYHINMKY